jgi:5-methylcytosine-specific restriction endonuclease McrA
MEFAIPKKRKPLTTKQRVEQFQLHKGKCCICGMQIMVGSKWIDEHELALELLGSNDMSNRGIAHLACAKVKTKTDMGLIAKAKRREAKHIGAKRPKKKIQSRGFKAYPSNTKYVNEGY